MGAEDEGLIEAKVGIVETKFEMGVGGDVVIINGAIIALGKPR